MKKEIYDFLKSINAQILNYRSGIAKTSPTFYKADILIDSYTTIQIHIHKNEDLINVIESIYKQGVKHGIRQGKNNVRLELKNLLQNE